MGENSTQQPKTYPFPQPVKSPLKNVHLPLSKVSFFPHQIAILIYLPYKSFICSCCHCCCIILFTLGFMYTHVMLILIIRCLLNVVLSMTKALNGQSSPKQNFYSPHLSMLFEKACFSFTLPFFISNFIKFLLTPLQLGLRGF